MSLTERKIKRYGWIPDLPDSRDLPYAAPHALLQKLPPSVDLRPGFAKVPAYDQGQLGSCTANAIAGALQYDQKVQKEPRDMPSRLFIYYNERKIEGTIQSDAGAMIRDGVKSVAKVGACSEKIWPYSDDTSDHPAPFQKTPTAAAYADATKHQVTSYQRVPHSLPAMKACLAEKFPFVFGFTVYESFEDQAWWPTGKMPMPAHGEGVLGGHAVLCVGYDDSIQSFIVRNSWGASWAKNGYFFMPYLFAIGTDAQGHANANDFWTLRQIE
ncbi:MAG TPA: C1 family peptidase [Polyangia bacterium]|nr:C1 family peptidase [Polyangia bacterium]